MKEGVNKKVVNLFWEEVLVLVLILIFVFGFVTRLVVSRMDNVTMLKKNWRKFFFGQKKFVFDQGDLKRRKKLDLKTQLWVSQLVIYPKIGFFEIWKFPFLPIPSNSSISTSSSSSTWSIFWRKRGGEPSVPGQFGTNPIKL